MSVLSGAKNNRSFTLCPFSQHMVLLLCVFTTLNCERALILQWQQGINQSVSAVFLISLRWGTKHAPKATKFQGHWVLAPIAVTVRQIKNVPITLSSLCAASHDRWMICGIHVRSSDALSLGLLRFFSPSITLADDFEPAAKRSAYWWIVGGSCSAEKLALGFHHD